VKSLNSSVASVQNLQDLYPKYFPEEVKGMEADSLDAYLQKGVLSKRLKYNYDTAASQFTLSFSSSDKQKAEAFVRELWDRAASSLQERLRIEYATYLEILKNQLDVYGVDSKKDSTTMAAKIPTTRAYQVLLAYQEKTQFPFSGGQSTLIVPEAMRSRSKLVLVVFFGALFVAIILAFVFNAARRIRNSPEDMAKLRDALSKGGKKN
jgi:hypothetical protein